MTREWKVREGTFLINKVRYGLDENDECQEPVIGSCECKCFSRSEKNSGIRLQGQEHLEIYKIWFYMPSICIEYELSMTIRWFKVFGQVHSELFNRKEMENSGIKLWVNLLNTLSFCPGSFIIERLLTHRGNQHLFSTRWMSVRKRKKCVEFSIAWGRLKISRWPLHSCTIFEVYQEIPYDFLKFNFLHFTSHVKLLNIFRFEFKNVMGRGNKKIHIFIIC